MKYMKDFFSKKSNGLTFLLFVFSSIILYNDDIVLFFNVLDINWLTICNIFCSFILHAYIIHKCLKSLLYLEALIVLYFSNGIENKEITITLLKEIQIVFLEICKTVPQAASW